MESKKKVSVAFTAQKEPKFLQALRAKHGLKSKDQEQQDKLDAKSLKSKQHIAMQDTHFDVKEEDQPEVVVLKEGQLSKEEAEKMIVSGAGGGEGVLSAANKLTLTKSKDATDASSSSKQQSSKSKSKSKSKVPAAKRAKSLSTRNANTLSFGDEEEEEE